MTKTNWREEFERDYDITNPAEWTLGIVAETLIHARVEPFGSDASHITKLLRDLVEKTRQDAISESLDSVGEEWQHKAWHDPSCPAHTNHMRPESECNCVFSVLDDIIRRHRDQE